MAINPAEFYQLGAQAGGARMGGLPENLDKNRLMSMQLAPTLMAAQTNQQEAQMKAPYYQAMAGYYGQKYDPETLMAIQKSKEDIALRNVLTKLVGLKPSNLAENLNMMGITPTGPKAGGWFGNPSWFGKPTYQKSDILNYLQAQQAGGELEATDETEATMLANLQKKLLAAQMQPTV